MHLIKRSLTSTKLFAATLKRVTILAWRVSPVLYSAQLILYIITGLTPLAQAYLAGAVVNSLAFTATHSGTGQSVLFELVIAAVGIQMLSSQLNYLASYLDDRYNFGFDGYVQETLIKKFSELDQTYYDDPVSNDKLNKVEQNLFAMRGLSRQFFNVLSNIVQLTATAIVLFAFEPILVPVILIAFAPIITIEVSASTKRWRYWDRRGEGFRLQYYLRYILLDTKSIREVKLYNLSSTLRGRWRTAFEDTRRGQIAIESRAQKQRAGAGLLNAFVEGGIQIWLVLLVAGRGLSGIGQFVFYRQAIQSFSSAGQGMITSLHSMQESSLYVNDYFSILELSSRLPQPSVPVILGDGIPMIEFKNVSFKYPNAKPYALRHLNLVIEPGRDIAIIGENGAGKTTFVKLLMRLYDPTEGTILINGVDLRTVDISAWNRKLGVLFQDFNHYRPLTLRDNITISETDGEVDESALNRAIDQAGARELVTSLPNGLNQLLSNEFKSGTELSGGQWQRVALARSFYRNAPILILDEPTSAIDAKAEFEIFQEIATTQTEKTTIIISHRFSTVRNANQIIVLGHGEITESGTHAVLMAIPNGTYRELFETQAEAYR